MIWKLETEETDSPAAQATKDAEKGVSEARAQKKQNAPLSKNARQAQNSSSKRKRKQT